MARKKKHAEHIDESWLIPYCDLLTLLLALFFALWAISDENPQKYQELAIVFESELKSNGVMDFQAPLQQRDVTMLEKQKEVPSALNDESLKQTKERIEDYIEQRGLTDKLETKLSEDGLMIKIMNNALFDSGVAEVRSDSFGLAREISNLLVSNPPRQIEVSGHTDNVPVVGINFDSNWHLSVMRSVNFMKILLENDDLDPRDLTAKGFGEYKPAASNNTAEGRSLNRRVEVLIKPFD
ncbi:flagellar motor protein MotB (plasmid) [Rossellomorea sp. AcN35-11]|nr:flagellar motor protein MotB [Rossellomorea aquimaris]WJV32234.1 flagellar motor protein MotB [Rossellomorea sp. AcN35-11]